MSECRNVGGLGAFLPTESLRSNNIVLLTSSACHISRKSVATDCLELRMRFIILIGGEYLSFHIRNVGILSRIGYFSLICSATALEPLHPS